MLTQGLPTATAQVQAAIMKRPPNVAALMKRMNKLSKELAEKLEADDQDKSGKKPSEKAQKREEPGGTKKLEEDAGTKKHEKDTAAKKHEEDKDTAAKKPAEAIDPESLKTRAEVSRGLCR